MYMCVYSVMVLYIDIQAYGFLIEYFNSLLNLLLVISYDVTTITINLSPIII